MHGRVDCCSLPTDQWPEDGNAPTRKKLRDDFPGFVICPKVLIVQAVACCAIIAASNAKGFVRTRCRRLLWDVRPRTILKFGTR
jgi:hypothetical protein